MTYIEPQNSFSPDGSDQWLGALLSAWETPAAPEALDQRIFASYRERFGTESTLPIGALAQSATLFEVNQMKSCETCKEEFSDLFTFCPLDGAPLVAFGSEPAPEPNFVFTEVAAESAYAAPGGEAYHLTLLDDSGLVSRLSEQISLVAAESRLSWPELRRDPIGFARRSVMGFGGMIRRGLASPNVALAMATACAIVIAVVAALIIFDQHRSRLAHKKGIGDDLVVERIVEIPDAEPEQKNGHTGMNKGAGGGSQPKPEQPHGGGGGGRNEVTPANGGQLPPSAQNVLVTPPKPPDPHVPDPLLSQVGIDVDPNLLAKTTPQPFGVPNSTSTVPSSGPGNGDGMGTGNGPGVGQGDGAGAGPGRNGNMGNGDKNLGGGGPGGGVDYGRIFKINEVTQKTRIIAKPTPAYTEDARLNNTVGTVRLSAVLTASGQITNIKPLNQLPYGLTEKAVEACRRIQFTPAMKDGRPVSQFVTIEYNFNIY
jgi:TonB family protein